MSFVLQPRLKHEHIPQVILPIMSAGEMLGPHLTNWIWIEESLVAQLFLI